MRLVIIAIREVDGEVAIRLSEAEAEGEPPSTARERENAHILAGGIATLLDATGQVMRGDIH